MADHATTVFECSNPEVVKIFAQPYLLDLEVSDWKDGDTKYILHTSLKSTPKERVTATSKQFPDEVITCRYSSDTDQHSEICVMEYRNGEGKQIDLEQGYMFTLIPLNSPTDREAIKNKAVAFFARLDTKETDQNGKMFINWFNEEVCYTFEYDGEDLKKYRVEATKTKNDYSKKNDYSLIRFKVFEGHIRYDWQEIPITEPAKYMTF